MCVCVWQVTHANQVTSLLLNINPAGIQAQCVLFVCACRAPSVCLFACLLELGCASFTQLFGNTYDVKPCAYRGPRKANQGHDLGRPAPPGPRMRKCMHWSLSAYRQYTFYHTDVDSAIQTVIETVGIYGTDVQTVRLLKAFNF